MEAIDQNKAHPAVGAKKRNVSIDVMKGIAMILVILIHMRSQEFIGYGLLMVFFYAVPLYFLVSGYLLSSSVEKSGFGKYLRKRIVGLLVPYIVFFVLSFVWINTVVALLMGMEAFAFDIDWMHVLKAFVFAGEYLNSVAIVPPPIWFLHALFFVSLLFYFLIKIKYVGIQAAIAVLLYLCSMPLQDYLKDSPYWIVKMLPVALFFMLCGHFCKRIQIKVSKDRSEVFEESDPGGNTSIIPSFVAIPLFLCVLRLMQLGRGDMWNITSVWYFLGGLVFIAACYLVARESGNRVLVFVGKNSLYYLAIHPLVLELPFIQSLPEYLKDKALEGIALYLAYFAISFIVVSIVVYIVILIKGWLLSAGERRGGVSLVSGK